MESLKPSIEVDFEGFKKLAGEFFQAAPMVTQEQCDAGAKCLGLAYLGLKDLTAAQQHEGQIILKLAQDAVDEHDPVIVRGKAAIARLKRFASP
jgi:hypothetical protein